VVNWVPSLAAGSSDHRTRITPAQPSAAAAPSTNMNSRFAAFLRSADCRCFRRIANLLMIRVDPVLYPRKKAPPASLQRAANPARSTRAAAEPFRRSEGTVESPEWRWSTDPIPECTSNCGFRDWSSNSPERRSAARESSDQRLGRPVDTVAPSLREWCGSRSRPARADMNKSGWSRSRDPR